MVTILSFHYPVFGRFRLHHVGSISMQILLICSNHRSYTGSALLLPMHPLQPYPAVSLVYSKIDVFATRDDDDGTG